MPSRPNFPSDLTDEPWKVIEPLLPPAKHGGRPRTIDLRAVLDAMGPRPGPVHLNLAFSEPLLADPGPLPAGRQVGAPWHQRAENPPPLSEMTVRRVFY